KARANIQEIKKMLNVFRGKK
ncbi:DUF4222 domain-containing protein, partial [Escherichia coli]